MRTGSIALVAAPVMVSAPWGASTILVLIIRVLVLILVLVVRIEVSSLVVLVV